MWLVRLHVQINIGYLGKGNLKVMTNALVSKTDLIGSLDSLLTESLDLRQKSTHHKKL